MGQNTSREDRVGASAYFLKNRFYISEVDYQGETMRARHAFMSEPTVTSQLPGLGDAGARFRSAAFAAEQTHEIASEQPKDSSAKGARSPR
jgi:hypothetical protein